VRSDRGFPNDLSGEISDVVETDCQFDSRFRAPVAESCRAKTARLLCGQACLLQSEFALLYRREGDVLSAGQNVLCRRQVMLQRRSQEWDDCRGSSGGDKDLLLQRGKDRESRRPSCRLLPGEARLL